MGKRWQKWLDDTRAWWRAFFLQGFFSGLLLVLAVLYIPLLVMWTAGWQIEMRTLVPVTGLSVLLSFVLARSHYDELFTLLLFTSVGFLTVIGIAGWNEPTNWLDGVAAVLERALYWLYDALTGGINQDDTVFTLLVATLFWYMGYNAVWHVFRFDRVWRVLLPSAFLMFVHVLVYTGTQNLSGYVFAFVFVGLLLLVRSHLETRQWEWYLAGVRVPRLARGQLMRVGLVLAALAIAIAWLIPKSNLEERLQAFQEFMQSDPLRQLGEAWSRLFTPLDAEGPPTSDYFGGDSLNLGGAIRLGDQPVFYVQAPPDRRYYWRSRVYERYEGGRWLPSSAWRVTDAVPPLEVLVNAELIGQARVAVEQTFTIGVGGTRLLYAAPQPLSMSVAGRMDVLRIDESLKDLSPMNLSVMRPLRVLERGTRYTATSLMSVATAEQLRADSRVYPNWVLVPNAYADENVSPRIAEFARDIVTLAGAVTPYDQAKAIETWLRQNIIYNESITSAPAGVDAVEWFLFTSREGYCTYYATAMVLMLRTLGVPARMAAGFAQGEWDASIGQYVVRERDAHTWVEVYFPTYGWIEFEPTSAEQPISRDGEMPRPNPQPEDSAQLPTPTPTPSPTPSSTPSPTPTTERTPERQEQDLPPTATLTPTPTPTATPVIVPTVQPPVQPPPPPRNDFLSYLLPALGAAVLIFLLVLLLVLLALLLWWWWEWRGMGGLSPVARAYARLERYVKLIGMRTSDTQTPEEKRRVIVRNLPRSERPVTYIVRTYMNERYGNKRDSRASASDKAWYEARGLVLRRWLRKVFPFLPE